MKTFSEFFGFLDDPFKRTPDIDFFYPTTTHKEALDLLTYLISSDEPYAVITGDIGTGKTITIRKFISMLPANIVPAYILFTSLSPKEILQSILESYGVKADDITSKQELYSKIKQVFLELKNEGKRPLIIFDEAQNLSIEVLQEIRTFSNIETDKGNIVKTVLVGQKELNDKLNSDEVASLSQRITLKMEIKNIGLHEIKDYINFHFARAGRATVNIQGRVVSRIAKLTQGNPRLINILMERAVIAAFLDNSHSINGSHLTSAVSSINTIMVNIRKKQSKSSGSLILTTIIACTIIFAGYFIYDYYKANDVEVLVANKDIVIEKQPPVIVEPTFIEPIVIDNLSDGVIVDNESDTQGEVFPPVVLLPLEPEPIEPTTAAPKVEQKLVSVDSDTMSIPIGSKVVINSGILNVRSLPLIESDRVDSVSKGEEFMVIGEDDYWVKIDLGSGKVGWVFKRYIKVYK